MKKLFSFFALMLALAGSAKAQWTSPGNGTTYDLNELVAVSNGSVVFIGELPYSQERPIYRFMADITISPNDHLLITEHNFIEFDDVTLTIQGSMTTENMYSIPGNFFDKSHENENAHPRIRFEDATGASLLESCVFLTFSGIQIINSDVTFSNCQINHVDTFHQSSAVNVMNCDPVFTNCLFFDNEGAAIGSPVNGQGSPQILNCLFYYNVTANANQPQINLGPGATDTIRIMNCEVLGGGHDMSGGISIADLTNTGSTKILLKDNVVKDNRYGYNQQGYNLSSVIVGNQFIDNNLETNPNNGGSGISIYGMTTDNKAKLRNNLISGNLWGITAIYYHDIDLGTEDDWGHNLIYGNGNGGTEYALYDNAFSDITAIGNYWGSNDPDHAEQVIFHRPDLGETYGLVNYLPIYELHPIPLSLVATQKDNPQLSSDYQGVINLETNTINLFIPEDELSTLLIKVRLELPFGTTTDFPFGEVIDLSEPFSFTIDTPHGESQEWTINLDSDWGVEEPKAVNPMTTARIYPNPVSDRLFVEVNASRASEMSITIYNITGQKVMEENVNITTGINTPSVNTSSLTSGIYFVTVKANGFDQTMKFIVK